MKLGNLIDLDRLHAAPMPVRDRIMGCTVVQVGLAHVDDRPWLVIGFTKSQRGGAHEPHWITVPLDHAALFGPTAPATWMGQALQDLTTLAPDLASPVLAAAWKEAAHLVDGKDVGEVDAALEGILTRPVSLPTHSLDEDSIPRCECSCGCWSIVDATHDGPVRCEPCTTSRDRATHHVRTNP